MLGPRRTRLLLELDLTRPLLDPPASGWKRVTAHGVTSLRPLLAALARAREDGAVAGLLVRTGGEPQPLAVAQEIREGLLAFRAAGKTVWTWAESHAEHGRGTVSYYLAAAGEQVWLQPSGEIALTGFAAEATFLRDALDRIGVRVQVGARHEYKNAPNVFTERGFTTAHREITERLVGSAARQVSTTLAADRGLSVDTVLELIDRAPLGATDALAAGLVDRLGYRDEVYAAMREALGGDVELRYLAHYGAHPPALEAARRAVRRRRRRVGLIEVSGNIALGSAGSSPFASGAGSDRVCAALRAAGADDDVRAVVLRVDSPGGSYVASDAIWRATLQLREAGKPLVVSMARLAASGGYYVSMSADRIVALPATLTGSIGVFGGKLVIADLLGRLGIGYDAVAVGRNARQNSPRVEMDEAQLAALNAMLDRIYADFTTKVAGARGLDPAALDAVARGRVWTGVEALDAGLVDELGGLARAAEVARTLAGLPSDALLRLIPTPGLLDAVRRPRSSADDSRQVGVLPWNAGWGSWATLAAQAGLPPCGPLSAPPVELIG